MWLKPFSWFYSFRRCEGLKKGSGAGQRGGNDHDGEEKGKLHRTECNTAETESECSGKRSDGD